MDDQDYSNEGKSIWNFDRDRMMDLSFFMRLYSSHSPNWDLKNMHEALRSIRRTIFGTCKEGNKEKIKKAFDELEVKKREFETSPDGEKKKKAVEYYNLQEETFDLINEINKDEGFSFNTKDDEDGL